MQRVLAGAVAALGLLSACSSLPAAPNFTLTDQRGQPWQLSAQRGRPVALFFGFTHCRDTCPTTLAKLARAAASSKTNAEIAFVTVDPTRDTPAVLARYLTRFPGAPIAGLTGTTAQIQRVEARYHVWAQKLPAKSGTSGYDEAHIATVFIIDAQGRSRAIEDESDGVRHIARDLRAAG